MISALLPASACLAVTVQVREVDTIVNPAADQQLFPRFAGVFTKLRAFELIDLDRVVLLDADTLVLKNVDDLFDRPPMAAGPDFFRPLTGR